MAGLTLDTGALIALDRGDRAVIRLLATLNERGERLTLPAPVLAQAIRDPAQQARMARLVRQPTTDIVALDRGDAVRVGRLLAATQTADVVDAHVVVCAARAGQPVVTSDPDDLRRLDGRVALVAI